MIPVFHRSALAWPAHEAKRRVDHAMYVPLSGALQDDWSFDAHFAAYSLPSVERRLATDAALASGPTMVLFVVDVDGPGHVRTPEWWQQESAKIATLPGRPVVYATRGGYRILWCLRTPVRLQCVADAQRWALSYLSWLDLLEEKHGIVGDRHQGPWTALFRLPDVIRDKQRTIPEWIGSPDEVGLWSEPLVDPSQVQVADERDWEVPDFQVVDPTRVEEACLVLARAWPQTGRREAQLALAGALARGGWPIDEITEFLYAVCELAEPGNGDWSKRARAARSSVQKVEAGVSVQGWPSLARLVDPAAVDQASSLLGMAPKVLESDPGFARMVAAGAARETTRMFPSQAAAGGPPILSRDAHAERATSPAGALASNHRQVGDVRDVGSGPATTEGATTLTYDEIEAWYRTVVLPRLKKAKDDIAAAIDHKYLSRLFDRGKIILERPGDPDGDPVEALAAALVRRAPPAEAPIHELLVRFVGNETRAIDAISKARATTPAAEPAARVGQARVEDADGFQLVISGPNAGARRSNRENINRALDLFQITTTFDVFAKHKKVMVGLARPVLPDPGEFVRVQDHHVNKLYLDIESEFGFRADEGYFRMVIDNRAHENSFHPVLEWFDQLPPWDDVPRLDTWLVRLCGAKDTPFIRAVSRMILVAAVRRVRTPGCKFDEMLVLESPIQGTFKTSFVSALCADPAWFGNRLPLHSDTKTQMEATHGKMIIELGELANFSKADHNTVKDYLSRQYDESRMAYGHENTVTWRHFIVIATTNDQKYLKDPTGNRRYLPVKITRCDVAGLLEERDLLWSEACAAEAAGESIRLDPSLWAEAAVEQEERREKDPYEDRLTDILGGLSGKIKVVDVWSLLGFADVSLAQKIRVRDSMRQLGWEQVQRRDGGKVVSCFVSGEAECWLRPQGTTRVQVEQPRPQAPKA